MFNLFGFQLNSNPLFSPASPMATTAPLRSPSLTWSWSSPRRHLEQHLSDLHKCTNLSYALQIHGHVLKLGLHDHPYIAPKLISAYSLSHQINFSIRVFNQIHSPNVNHYNILIRAHLHHSDPSMAFSVFLRMQRAGVLPDTFTFPFLMKGVSQLGCSVKVLEMVHCCVVKLGFFGDLFVPNSLIDGYCRFGIEGIGCARKVFDEMPVRDVVSWNSMVSGMVRVGELWEARKLFDEMPERDGVSWNVVLDGYVKGGDMAGAFELFEGMPERNVVSWSTMVSGYCKVGDMEMARMLFDRMPVRNLVSWTIIISGCAEKGLVKEALWLYKELQKTGLRLDDVSYVSILSACAESGFLGLGKIVHGSIKDAGFRCSVAVCNALIDMYMKCGAVKKGMDVFEGMVRRDLVSWNVVIQGLGMHGHGETALEIFARMKEDRIPPDGVTFIGLLCACTHTGYIDEGLSYFNGMEKDHGVMPQVEHYGCLVDLLGRGGRLKEAMQVVRTMPMEPNAVIWGTLLVACRVHNAAELASEVLDCLIKLEPSNAGNFSMLSNVCAAVGDWEGAANARQRMKNTGTRKPSGASSIEVDDEVHDFTVFDKSHPNSEGIYEMIDMLQLQVKQKSHSEALVS